MGPLNSPTSTSLRPELLFNSPPLSLRDGRFVANYHVDDIYQHKYEKGYEETVQANKRKGYIPSIGLADSLSGLIFNSKAERKATVEHWESCKLLSQSPDPSTRIR